MAAIDLTAALQPGGVRDLGQAAAAFEAYFLRRMLSEVRGTAGLAGDGVGARMFRDMLDEALADAMAEGGGVGIADTLVDQLRDVAPAAALPRPGAYGEAAGALQVTPVAAPLSSTFGERVDPIEGDRRFHAGVDLAAPEGTPVVAAGAGTVVRAGPAGGYGNLVVVDHGGGVHTRYAHLSDIAVQVGDRVAAGARIGAVGATGRATGPHLHFEVRRDGRPVDPTREIALKGFAARSNR
ncbi:MAG: peptidase M23 [Deltaproteobacteria bacterium]|nr:MAG: peptidase M23 [Deltaproteobacteria bacterium]